jgi:hypothetical protein
MPAVGADRGEEPLARKGAKPSKWSGECGARYSLLGDICDFLRKRFAESSGEIVKTLSSEQTQPPQWKIASKNGG